MRSLALALVVATLLTACVGDADDPVQTLTTGTASPTQTPQRPVAGEPAASPSPEGSSAPAAGTATEAPDWLGTRVLPEGASGFGTVVPTPPELVDRRIVTTDLLPPPAGEAFEFELGPVPDAVLARSTWQEACPVTAAELAYVTVAFWGFDDRPHTGELLVAASVAEDVVEVFRTAFEARFPIEEMRIVTPEELDAPPTGDGNNTTAFVCRPVRGSQRWSQHAYGLAVDVNPFHNPYVKGALVLPELASAYTDRSWERPGMLREDGPVVSAFDDAGWHWGGRWDEPVDLMHFSRDGG
ncbi:MAG: M15 family metallopeptidase [Nitriliruptorales bacterium]|nr:M15 family metallopeptidase [Nitriliruptorales bacterium]